jgi:hypothetical protein
MDIQKVKCKICGEKLKLISWLHLRIHNITLEEYKKIFPNSKIYSDYWLKLQKNKAILGAKKLNELIQKRRKEKPSYDKKYREDCAKGGRNRNKFYPELIKKITKKTHETIKKRRKKDPEYDKKYREEMRRKSLIGIKNWRKKKPYWFMGVPFDSNEEMECAKLFNKYFGWIPEERINCHIKLKNGEIDFLVNDIFIEYHRWESKNKINEYYQKRRKILDKNGKNNELFVFRNLGDVKTFCLKIKGD